MSFLYCPGKSQKGLFLKCFSRQWRPRITFGQRITTNAFNPKNKTYFAQTIDHSPIIMSLLCWQKTLAIEISVCPQKNANTCSRVANRVLFWKEIYGALRSNQVLFAPQSIWRRKPWKGLFWRKNGFSSSSVPGGSCFLKIERATALLQDSSSRCPFHGEKLSKKPPLIC